MKTKIAISIMVSSAVLLAACGGGSNTASTLTKSSFKITGTVPGTLIEAFCEDGSYYSVNSDNNGTRQHPFALSVPTDLSCRLVMTTNEDDINNKVVTPIKFVKADTSSIAFSGTEDIDLSHINLALSRAEMRSDTNNDGVEDEPIEVDLGESAEVEVIVNTNDPMDKDGDDIIDIYEDDDNDGVNNRDDDDDDGDGILDINDSDHDNDLDGDGIANQEDVDDDNDGLSDDHDEDKDKDEDSDHDDDYTPTDPMTPTDPGTPTTPPPVVTSPSAGRLLASQCAQCHRTDANPNKGFEDLIGEDVYGELIEMKRKNKVELMHLQAKGYSDEQIRLMDDYFRNLSNKGGK